MRRLRLGVIALSIPVLLAACGGSSDDKEPLPQEPAGPPPRGSLIESPAPLVRSLSPADLVVALGGKLEGEAFLRVAGSPTCRVDVHQLRYHSVGVNDEPVTASGALMIPAGIEPECQGERPILLYAHGTNTNRAFNMVDVTSEDNLEAALMAVAFAARGYIVVAPNYVGFDSSDAPYHPYLNADQSAKDMMHALSAARSTIPTRDAPITRASNQLFITGYSQGGHVAMAAHRAMQSAGMPVTASAPMSGPYALAAFGDAVFQGQVNASAPLFLSWMLTGYDRAYGDLYSAPTDVFQSPYAADIETLLPSTLSRSELYSTGRLPRDQLFSEVPPDPAFAPYTPATAPAELADVFARGFGPQHLITSSFRLAYLQDAQANPDGAFPNTTDAAPAATPAHPLRRAFKTNDLRNWTPSSPVFLCGGHDDPTVYYFNTQFMQSYWAPSGAPVSVLDVDSSSEANDPYEDLKDGFEATKVLVAANAVIGGAGDGGDAAVLEAYHTTLVAPFCLTAVARYFDALVP